MKRNEVKKGTSTALVTGGNSGIGLCYARRLAASGYNIVIAALDAGRNRCAAEQISSACGVRVRTLEIDLAREQAARELYDFTCKEGIEVEVLINNAGMFSYLDLIACPEERMRRMLLLHNYTPTFLCRYYGEEMARRGHGWILNMSSYSLWMPWPGLALYGASKSYLRSFSTAFSKEVRERGVHVTSVCPAGVATDLYGLPERWQRIGVKLGVLLTADSCARRGLRAMWNGRRNCVPGLWNRLFIPLCVAMPMCVLRLARKHTYKLQR